MSMVTEACGQNHDLNLCAFCIDRWYCDMAHDVRLIHLSLFRDYLESIPGSVRDEKWSLLYYHHYPQVSHLYKPRHQQSVESPYAKIDSSAAI